MAKKTHTGRVVGEVGIGLAAVGAAAALGYYFYGSDTAHKHRRIAAKWARDMKKEVIRETKKLKEDNPEVFAMVVDRVARAYRNIGGIDKTELQRAARELKANWKLVRQEATKTKRVSKKTVKKVRKAATTTRA